MSALRHVTGAVVLAVVSAPLAEGQTPVIYDLRLFRPGYPDFDASALIHGSAGEEHLFSADMVITLSQGGSSGVQGWSISLRHEGIEVVGLSVEGTVSAPVADGGLLDQGFIKYEIVDPVTNEGRTGVVQAVVLAFLRSVELPQGASSHVGRNTYRARHGSGPSLAFIGYEAGLIGSGQPVLNNATVAGSTAMPVTTARRIGLTPTDGGIEADCQDGEDDNDNGWTDCADPSCALQPACGAEDCGDGIDNDDDRLVDCRDFDCRLDSRCRRPEDCSNKLDDDRDLRVDCSDPDCFEVGDCPGPEICGDTLDNDLDGATDCKDRELSPSTSQSLARARYRVKEAFTGTASGRTLVEFKDGLRGSGQPLHNAFTVQGATQNPTRLLPLELRLGKLSSPFLRGDVNLDRKVNLADAIWCINELIRRGPQTPCRLAGDVNADGYFDLSDSVYLVLWQFLGGPVIPPPYPECGVAVGSPSLACPEGAVPQCE